MPVAEGLRLVVFGTFDARHHPRVQVLIEGLAELGHDVQVVNVPLALDTAARVRLAAQPWRAPVVIARLLTAWIRLLVRSRRVRRPDMVIVGYLSHIDVHLARLRWPRVPIAVDHMVSLADTVRDRGVDQWSLVVRALALADRASTRIADLVIIDTPDNRDTVPEQHRHKAVVVPVGAPRAWFEARRSPTPADASPQLGVVFYGLYTPLQGAPTIGQAAGKLANHDIAWTMIGVGQDRAAAEAAAAGADISWIDWVPAENLPGVVASHDVCLGIFGSGPKAMRVVPNKVFQGAAAGCAVVTSDTPAQRELLGDAAVFVPPDDAAALAGALATLADDRAALAAKRRAAIDCALSDFTPGAVVAGLAERLTRAHDERMSRTASVPPLAPNAALRWHVVQRRLDEIRPESVLELGTGQGSAGARLSARARYVGVEPDRESRAVARERLPDEARLLDDLSDLDDGETFDLACAFEVLEHIRDDREALTAWVQYLRPGGHVLVSVPADPDRFAAGDELAGHFRRYSEDSLAALLESSGLEVVHIERYGYPLGSALETGRNLIAARRIARQTSPGDLTKRTAGSGRHLQPPGWSGTAIWFATWPFRTAQERFPRRGRGFLALGRRPG